MRLFGLIGYPLTHSFSRRYFTEKFEREGIPGCRYELFPLERIEELPALLAQYPELEGLNVTIPYKKEVLRYLDTSTLPPGLAACNCIRIRQGRREAYNTDFLGFEKSLVPLLQPQHRQALVLGNGGATEAVVYALRRLGIGFAIVSRALHGGSTLTYDQLTPAIIKTHTLIINTTPLGMHPHTDECPKLPYGSIGTEHLLYDLVYNPAQTLFLQKGKAQGAAVKNGEEMLVLQAEESWSIWGNGN